MLQSIRHEHEVIPKIERWRELTKLAQTYLDALPLLIAQDGRIHTTFNQTAATTGRLSSNNPNLQNIPIRTALGREIRACFVAEPGDLLVSADYSQVELRLLAHIAGEDALKEIFRKGEDVHTATACRVFGVTPEQIDPGMRSKAKMINYGIVYGLSAWGMADRLDIPQEEADEFIQRYLAGFPAVARWIEETITQGTEHGYVSTLFGRRRQVPELRARRWDLRKQGERFAVNMVIQGTAADIMKVAMVRCDQALKERRAAVAHDPPDPRRAAVRRPRRGGRGGQAHRHRADGRSVRDGSAARRRRRDRPRLAGGEVTARAFVPAVVVAAVLALAAAALPAAAQAKFIGGVIPDGPARRARPRRDASRPCRADLPYGGGPVLHSNRTHPIFWEPAGSGLTFDPGYESLIETFLTDVAADSHKTTNMFSLTGQYRDSKGPAAYDSTYGGAVVDTDPLPPNGCTEPGPTGPGWTVCLTDAQLQTEIEHVVAANHLPTTGGNVYFMITPDGFGSCTGRGPSSCALGGSADGYCGYHSETSNGILYAVIPYNAVPAPLPVGQPATELEHRPIRRSRRSATSRTRRSPTRTATPGSTPRATRRPTCA